MSHKLVRLLVFALVVLMIAPVQTLAAPETVSGVVQEVDADSERLVITTDDNQTRELTAPKALLKRLAPGDEVKVRIFNGTVTAIDKKDAEA